MIRVVCHTNLDLANERWPDKLPTVPRVGDQIVSATKWGDFSLALQVYGVTWRPSTCLQTKVTEWIPYVDLHMTNMQKNLPSSKGQPGSITAFYEWYAPRVGRTVSSFI